MSNLRHLKYRHSKFGLTFTELIIATAVALILSALGVLIFVGSTREIAVIKKTTDKYKDNCIIEKYIKEIFDDGI